MARRVAERLAAGQLQERLRVTGEDDLARLATSFNQMATQPAAPDPPARGAQPGAAPLRLRRLPRAAHAADHRADGRRRAARRPRTTSTRRPRRAAELLQSELDRFETLLVDLLEISRFDAGAAVLDLDDVNLVDVAHRVVDMTRALAEQRGVQVVVRRARPRRAWPRPTYAGSSGSCATWSPTPSTTPSRAATPRS